MAFWKSRKDYTYLIHRKNTDCAAWSCLKIQQPRYWMLFICIVNILLITKGNSRHVCSRGPLQRGHPKYTKNIIQQTSQNLRKNLEKRSVCEYQYQVIIPINIFSSKHFTDSWLVHCSPQRPPIGSFCQKHNSASRYEAIQLQLRDFSCYINGGILNKCLGKV